MADPSPIETLTTAFAGLNASIRAPRQISTLRPMEMDVPPETYVGQSIDDPLPNAANRHLHIVPRTNRTVLPTARMGSGRLISDAVTTTGLSIPDTTPTPDRIVPAVCLCSADRLQQA